MNTMDGSQETNSNMSQGLESGQAADTHTTNEVAILTAELAEAVKVVRALQQQNKELGSVNADIALQMRDMQAQMQEERAEMQRFMSGEMPKDYSPPKR
jgi:DNA integrity scanning protein DisA with diadenylate cyclase activity